MNEAEHAAVAAYLAEFDVRAESAEASAEYIRAEVSRAMREVARLHLPRVRWTRVPVPGSSVPGYLAERVDPREFAAYQELCS